jgi:cysteine desulfurase
MIYADFNASTPLDGDVELAMRNADNFFANPSSSQHRSGYLAQQIVEDARDSIAHSLNVNPQEIIFTSGATEAALLAIWGIGLGIEHKGILAITTEHKAVLNACDSLVKISPRDFQRLPVNSGGGIDLDQLESQLEGEAGLLTAMAVNNETGRIQDMAAIGKLCREKDVRLVSDATQAIGKIDVSDFREIADAYFMSGHKIYGPKGSGVLVASRDIQKLMVPVLVGGGQERGLRGGTSNTSAIAGLAVAIHKATQELEQVDRQMVQLRETFLAALKSCEIEFEHLVPLENATPNTIAIRLTGLDADAIIAAAPSIEVSTGSACDHANPEPSHVYLAQGLTPKEAREVIRFSFGKPTTNNDVEALVAELNGANMFLRQTAGVA